MNKYILLSKSALCSQTCRLSLSVISSGFHVKKTKAYQYVERSCDCVVPLTELKHNCTEEITHDPLLPQPEELRQY